MIKKLISILSSFCLQFYKLKLNYVFIFVLLLFIKCYHFCCKFILETQDLEYLYF